MGQSSIKKNYAYSLIYQLLSIILPFITTPYVARVLGADGVGIFSYTKSCMTYFTLIAMMGTSTYGTREIARSRNDKLNYSKKFWEIELLTILTTMSCLLAWGIILLLSGRYAIYYKALIPLLLSSLFDISWFFAGHEKIGCTIWGNIVFKVIGVIFVFCFIKTRADVALYISIYSCSVMLGNLSMWLFLPQMLVPIDIKKIRIKHHFKESFIYFIPTIATTIYTVMDKTLIGWFTKDYYQSGYYEEATKIINMAKVSTYVSINTAMSARMSYLFFEKKDSEIKEKIQLSMDYVFLIGCGLVFGLVAIAEDYVRVFLGRSYEPVVTMIYYMVPLILIISISNCLSAQYYIPAGLRGKSSKYIIIGAIVNLFLNVFLIPQYGAVGAIVASVVAETIISMLFLVNCNNFLTLWYLFACSCKRIIAGIVMFIVIREMKLPLTGSIKLLLEIFVGIIIYFFSLILMQDRLILLFVKTLNRKF